MKRFTALIMLVVLVFSLFACGEEQKAEKYCWNCGEGITKEASFCEHCGTNLNETQNESSGPVENEKSSSVESSDDVSKIEESQSDEISKEETQEKTESSEIESSAEPEESDEPEQPVHTHSYSKKVTEPTCTEKGYTTYTCSCGDTYTGDETKAKEHIYSKKVTEPTCTEKGYTTYTCSCGDTYKDAETKAKGHTYFKYVCSVCGVVDTTHSYEYLVEWVKDNGTKDEDGNIRFVIDEYADTEYALVYLTDEKELRVQYIGITLEEVAFAVIYLSDYYYGFGFWGNTVTGYLDAKTYTTDSILEYDEYQGDTSDKNSVLSLTKTSVDTLLEGLKYCLLINDIPITLADLGFSSY